MLYDPSYSLPPGPALAAAPANILARSVSSVVNPTAAVWHAVPSSAHALADYGGGACDDGDESNRVIAGAVSLPVLHIRLHRRQERADGARVAVRAWAWIDGIDEISRRLHGLNFGVRVGCPHALPLSPSRSPLLLP